VNFQHSIFLFDGLYCMALIRQIDFDLEFLVYTKTRRSNLTAGFRLDVLQNQSNIVTTLCELSFSIFLLTQCSQALLSIVSLKAVNTYIICSSDLSNLPSRESENLSITAKSYSCTLIGVKTLLLIIDWLGSVTLVPRYPKYESFFLSSIACCP
jgi:hypothetical protein